MAEVTSFVPGSFSWFELATTDQNSAKDFYSKLFGWGINDFPYGEGQFYSMMQMRGKDVSAVYGMGPEETAQGLPPHWRVYITVKDAAEAAEKAKSLGANVLMGPFDVMGMGNMAVIQDPTGAVFMVWEPKQHIGASIIDEPNAFCWYELNTHDTEKAKDFYTKFLGWNTGGSPDYTEWKQGDRSIGGMMKIMPEWGNVPPNWTAYIMVENADATAEKAKSLGGNVIMGPNEIPNTGRFAIIADPQGAVFAIYEPLRK